MFSSGSVLPTSQKILLFLTKCHHTVTSGFRLRQLDFVPAAGSRIIADAAPAAMTHSY
jgi:hypothetical protein